MELVLYAETKYILAAADRAFDIAQRDYIHVSFT